MVIKELMKRINHNNLLVNKLNSLILKQVNIEMSREIYFLNKII